ncbi:unnamed protein product [marine sediment metagenome]|uniref:Uncharacterized protein n=1 Tax=marine sediment metagenome TaxID=412755 RepID=X1E2C3_9ZZZZ
MMNKSDSYKDQYGCSSCKYETKSRMYERCIDCRRRKGSKWVAVPKVPEKVFCECCGAEKHDG